MQIPVFGPFVIWPINSYFTPRIYSLGVSLGIESFETQFYLTAGIWRAVLFCYFHVHDFLGRCVSSVLLSIHRVLMLDVDFHN